jgi:opacity protein-like surface antigen
LPSIVHVAIHEHPEDFMKQIARLVGIAALALSPAIVSAQDAMAKTLSFGVSGGASIPMGDLSSGGALGIGGVNTGYNVTGHLLLSPASMPRLGFRADVSWDSWKAKEVLGVDPDVTLRTLGISGNVIFKSAAPMSMKPYLLGGVGAYNSKQSGSFGGSGSGSSESNTSLGIQGGGGLEFQLSGFTTFLEAKFVNAFTEGSSTSWVPVTFGIRF